MPHCAAFGCNFQSKGNRKTNVSIHSFPRDTKVRKQWENAVGRLQLPRDARLCSRHFSPDTFEEFDRPRLQLELTGTTFKRRLKPGAVPTLFLRKEGKRPRITSENREKKRERQLMLDTLLQSSPKPSGCTVAGDESLVTDSMPIMETDMPLTLVVESGAQCSPSMTDVATQTDIGLQYVSKSEAAVQWPDDAAYSTTNDHPYSGKNPIDLISQVEEGDVSSSQDLFLSDFELSEQSQEPQLSQSDNEYCPSSDESPSTQESQASTTTPIDNRLFLVFEDQLKQLLQRCLKCGSLVVQEDMKELLNEGSQLTLELTCNNNCSYRWQSQPPMSGTKGKGNLLLTASVFFSGIHFAKFERFCNNMNLKTISEDTYSGLRKRFVFPVIEKMWEKEQSTVLSALKSQEVVELCGDGRCDSPGHSAKYCTYTFLDAQSEKVVDFKVISCTQVSSSNTMEIKGFKDSLRTIEENGVKVHTVSTDRHPQIVKEMRVRHPVKHHEFDPWHVTKGVSKKLSALAKRKECEDLEQWIPSIINHLWWSAQTCEGDSQVLIEKWVSVIHHVTNRHDWPGNRFYHECAHEPLDALTQMNKLWLKPGSESHNALVNVVKDKRLLKDLTHMTKCIHTTTLEV